MSNNVFYDFMTVHLNAIMTERCTEDDYIRNFKGPCTAPTREIKSSISMGKATFAKKRLFTGKLH